MKKTLLILLALLTVACRLTEMTANSPSPVATAKDPATAPSAPIVTQTMTALVPSETPLPTSTPEPVVTPSATPFTEPVIDARFPMYTDDDGLGYGVRLLALPGGQVWETTLGGGVRVYDSTDMTVLQSLDLGGQANGFSWLVGDTQYAWAMFSNPMNQANPTSLFRISRADTTVEPVDLPVTCTYDDCLWSTLLIDDEIVWVGGYDELLGIDRETMEPVTKFLFSEQAQTFNPAEVKDIAVTDDGQVWSLFCSDTCYIVILDRQKLLDGVEQEPGFISFENAWVEFMTFAGGTMWAGERDRDDDDVPAVLYKLDETGVELRPEDGIAVPEGLNFFNFVGMNNTEDGHYLWVLDEEGRRLFWVDPEAEEVAGVMQVYPGEAEGEDQNMILSISFDGQYLWTGGSEILRIAAPWFQ